MDKEIQILKNNDTDDFYDLIKVFEEAPSPCSAFYVAIAWLCRVIYMYSACSRGFCIWYFSCTVFLILTLKP
jgi:hypothetical protein